MGHVVRMWTMRNACNISVLKPVENKLLGGSSGRGR